jgi:hypothetical protein
MAMHGLAEWKCTVQGLPLIKDGCVQTEVDLKELFNRMRLGIEEAIPEVDIPCPDDKAASKTLT